MKGGKTNFMENSTFWAFLAITFIVGLTLGIAIYGLPANITGRAMVSPMIPGINCNDTDGGINLAVKGTCVDPYGSKTDVCASPIDLVEYWCTDVSCVSKIYNCPQYGYSNCSNGACVGGNETTQGTGGGVGCHYVYNQQTQEYDCVRDGGFGQSWCDCSSAQVQGVGGNETTGCTYQGILNMLNQCTITVARNNSDASCDNVCQQQSKTCIQAYSFDEISEVTLPSQCNWIAGTVTNTMICNCCLPSSGAQTMGTGGNVVCHYDYEGNCLSGIGRWRCDNQCGEATPMGTPHSGKCESRAFFMPSGCNQESCNIYCRGKCYVPGVTCSVGASCDEDVCFCECTGGGMGAG